MGPGGSRPRVGFPASPALSGAWGTDAAILTMLVDTIVPTGLVCVVVTADQCLLRAADAEGLKPLKSELVSAAEAPSVLATIAQPQASSSCPYGPVWPASAATSSAVR